MKWAKKQSKMFPELLLFETEAEQKRVFKVASKGIYLNPLYWLLLIGLAVFMNIVLRSAGRTFGPTFSVPESMVGGIAGGISGGLSAAGALWISKRKIQYSLRKQLNDTGVSICMKCGYQLQGNTSGVCSECGTRIENLVESDREKNS